MNHYLFLLVRELGNGIWFMLSMILAAAFLVYIWRNWDQKWTVDRALAVNAAGGLTIWFLGSGLRAGVMWLQWVYSPEGQVPVPWVSSTQFYIISTVLGLIGATWAVTVFVYWKLWVMALIFAVLVPVVVHVIRTV